MPLVIPKLHALLVEDAVDNLERFLRDNFNAFLTQVWKDYEQDGRKINLEKVPDSAFYVSERFKPFLAPALFILPDASGHDLNQGQNWEYTIHEITVAAVVEDIEEARLTRKCWRFARGLWMALHDRQFYNVYCLIDSLTYSPILVGPEIGDSRRFRKDVSVHCKVHHFEKLL